MGSLAENEKSQDTEASRLAYAVSLRHNTGSMTDPKMILS